MRGSGRIFYPLRFICVVLALVTGLFSRANASVVFAPFLSYSSRQVNDASGGSGGDRSSKLLTVDARVGYLFDGNGLLVGAMYKLENGGGDLDLQGFLAGPSIGYVNMGFGAVFTYFIAGESRYTRGSVENKFTEGIGYQFDISYAFPIASGLALGPQVVYRTVKYQESQIGTASPTSTPMKIDDFTPGLGIWFSF